MRLRTSRSATGSVVRSNVPPARISPRISCARSTAARLASIHASSAVGAQHVGGQVRVQREEVVAQRRARHRRPAVVAREQRDLVAQPVQVQPAAEQEVQRRDLRRPARSVAAATSTMSSAENSAPCDATRPASASGTPCVGELLDALAPRLLLGLDQHARQRARHDPRAVARSARPRPRCPAAAAACAAASASRARPSAGCASSISICASAARRRRPAPRSRATATRMSNTSRAISEARAMSACDAPVSSRRRNMNVVPARSTRSLATRVAMISRRSRWRAHLVAEALGQRRREVARELAVERRVVGQVGVQQRRVQRDLGVGEHDRQLGLRQARARPCGARRPSRRRAAPRARGRAAPWPRGRA